MKDPRRRPLLRPSQQSGGGPPSPSPKGVAGQGGQKRGGPGTAVSPSKKAGSDNGVRCGSWASGVGGSACGCGIPPRHHSSLFMHGQALESVLCLCLRP